MGTVPIKLLLLLFAPAKSYWPDLANTAGLAHDLDLDLGSNNALEVHYKDLKVETGKKMALSDVQKEPKVKCEDVDAKKKYTLVMVDPDAPSNKEPKDREWLHWLRVNVEGKDLQSGSVTTSGKQLRGFKPSKPSPATGHHRYCFLLFEQPNGDLKGNLEEIKEGPNFHVAEFASKHGLAKKVFAFTFFQVDNQEDPEE